MKNKICITLAIILSFSLTIGLTFVFPLVSTTVFGLLRFGALCIAMAPIVYALFTQNTP